MQLVIYYGAPLHTEDVNSTFQFQLLFVHTALVIPGIPTTPSMYTSIYIDTYRTIGYMAPYMDPLWVYTSIFSCHTPEDERIEPEVIMRIGADG